MRALLAHKEGRLGLMSRLKYGTGMRLMECVRLRVLDLDFDNGLILVRNGKDGSSAGREKGPGSNGANLRIFILKIRYLQRKQHKRGATRTPFRVVSAHGTASNVASRRRRGRANRCFIGIPA